MRLVGVSSRAALGSSRRLLAASCAACSILAAGVACAQPGWKPDKPVEWLVPASPGSQLDAIVRLAQTLLQKRKLTDVPIVPVNKAGAGQSIAAGQLLNRAPGDGQSLLVMSATLLSSHALGAHRIDFTAATALAYLGAEYYVFAVRADSAIASGKDLIARLKRDPRSITVGASNPGGIGHIQMLAVLHAAGVDTKQLVVVGFKGGSQVRTALLNGDIELTSTSGSNLLGQVKAGRVRAIAVNAPERLPGLYQQAPTWRELGVDAPVLAGWAAVLGPRAMTAEQVAFWERVLEEAMKAPEWVADAERRLRSLDYRNAAATREFIAKEYETLRSVIGKVGISGR